METIYTAYKASDGKIFEKEEDCVRHEIKTRYEELQKNFFDRDTDQFLYHLMGIDVHWHDKTIRQIFDFYRLISGYQVTSMIPKEEAKPVPVPEVHPSPAMQHPLDKI